MMNNLDFVEKWILSMKEAIEEAGFEVELVGGTGVHITCRGFYLRKGASNLFFCTWDTGECELEYLDQNSEVRSLHFDDVFSEGKVVRLLGECLKLSGLRFSSDHQ